MSKIDLTVPDLGNFDEVAVVGAPRGSRPFRVHIDPAQDGADVGFAVLDRLRAEMLHRTGLSELLQVASR